MHIYEKNSIKILILLILNAMFYEKSANLKRKQLC